MKYTFFMFAVFILTNLAFAQPKIIEEKTGEISTATDDASQFYIEKNLVDTVYKQTVSEEEMLHSRGGVMTPQIGVFSASRFFVSNEYFAVDYAEELGSIPFASFALAKPIYGMDQFSVFGKGEVGFSYKQGTYKALSTSGPAIEDSITLQWVPILAGLVFEYQPAWANWIKPSISIFTGANWLHHSGTIDGLDYSEWVPVYGYGPAFSFLTSNKEEEGIFEGFTISATFQKSTDSEHKIEGWEYKLGSSIIL